jgi:hypothetical protein
MKKFSHSRGQNIMELVIGVALIAIVAIVALNALGGNIHTMFSKSNDAAKTYKPFAWKPVNNNSSTYTPIVNTGTPAPDNPIQTCTGNTCTIDFGDFVITGLNDNFSEIVETAGTAGATDNLMGILDKVIEQLEQTYDPADLKIIKDLANKGHSLATYQRDLQTSARLIENSSSYNDLLNSISATGTNLSSAQSSMGDFNSLLNAINSTYGGNDSPLPPEISNSILAVVNSMSQEISVLNTEMTNNTASLLTESSNILSTKTETDLIYPSDLTIPSTILKVIDKPIYGDRTDLDSEIICKTAKGEDFDKNCT